MAKYANEYLHIGSARDIENRADRALYRAFEILPGALTWATIFLMFFLSWKFPVFAAIFIIVFDVYWFFKTVFLALYSRIAFSRLREYEKIDWMAKLKHVSRDRYREIYHLVIIPMYLEPYEIIHASLQALSDARYPKDRFIVVLAGEARAGTHTQEIFDVAQRDFGNAFFSFLTTAHPDNLPGEIPGKGANETWAAKFVKAEVIDRLKIRHEDVLVSVFDADTRIGAEYFSRLTYAFLTSKHPYRSSYQPIPLFINNIFTAPALARVISFSATFWHLIQQARQHRLTTFSSHSMPFKALVEIGYWQTNIVSEDSRIFWQCFLYYNGDWRVEPLHYSVAMDANVAPTFWQTIKNQYRQQRRWGYGVENVPYILFGFMKNKKIPVLKKFEHAFVKIEGFHSWATNALMIFLLGWLPILIGGDAFKFSLLSFNLPDITRAIMLFASVGIVTSAILSIILLPPKPAGFRKRQYALYLFQWVLLPVTLIIFGAFPAIDAQTRLMAGKYMGFWVTPKFRQKKNHSH